VIRTCEPAGRGSRHPFRGDGAGPVLDTAHASLAPAETASISGDAAPGNQPDGGLAVGFAPERGPWVANSPPVCYATA